MKKKLLVITLCFTLIFSSLSYKKSYADGGVISLPMLATVSALAVGTGIIIKNSDDLYDLGRIFYDYVDKHNDLTLATVQSVFTSSVFLRPDKLVSVKSDFLDIVKDFFDNTFNVSNDISYVGLVPSIDDVYLRQEKALKIPDNIMNNLNVAMPLGFSFETSSHGVKDVYCMVRSASYGNVEFVVGYYVDNVFYSYSSYVIRPTESMSIAFNYPVTHLYMYPSSSYSKGVKFSNVTSTDVFNFPYSGGYTWDNVDNKKENDKVALPIPGDLGSLVGQGSKDFWGNTDNLVGNGNLSLPSVDSPSIGVDSSTTFPSIDSPTVDSPSVPNEGIWATIKEFIISLVVPKDSFWTDTWGGLYNNFTSSFPMVDMDGFNSLVTGEKKFPNIDINIMGVSGRVVNGDVINSIVDWLRPIVAGFMMLCLMFFNYRKIYKLIRNSEPFGGIAPGNNSDINTGISEYSKHEVVKATDMVSEYRAWRERGGK